MEQFEVGTIYRRRDLHDKYGGQRQGGISTPAKYSMVMLFFGDKGDLFGYKDGWDPDGTFHYTGEGQIGDMVFTRGNRAIRDHTANSKDLHLFMAERKGYVKYISRMMCVDYFIDTNSLDLKDHPRSAIVFRLRELHA